MKEVNQADKIKELLANHIGVEPEDINNDDFFSEDLHMTAADLTDFSQVLEKEGFHTSKIDFTEIETVGDLIETVGFQEDLG